MGTGAWGPPAGDRGRNGRAISTRRGRVLIMISVVVPPAGWGWPLAAGGRGGLSAGSVAGGFRDPRVPARDCLRVPRIGRFVSAGLGLLAVSIRVGFGRDTGARAMGARRGAASSYRGTVVHGR